MRFQSPIVYVCYRFLLFVGAANTTDIWVFINKPTFLYSQLVVCRLQNGFENNPFDSNIATGGLCLNMERRGAILRPRWGVCAPLLPESNALISPNP